jgi:hypothetical protein
MEDIETRIQNAIEEITGNESLLEMLDTDAATEMLAWGKELVTQIVKQTAGMPEEAAEQALLIQLKAIRQVMRMVGNWAVGKYSDATNRAQLRERLLESLQTIFGEAAKPPSSSEMDKLLNEVDDQQNDPQKLILKLKTMLNEKDLGDTDNVQKA